MYKKKYTFLPLFLVVILSITISLHASPLLFFEKSLFGSTSASQEDAELFVEVQEFLGASEDHGLFYSRYPWNYFSSFTWLSGTWINKDEWENFTVDEKIFTAYHEIAHTTCNHPIKQSAAVLCAMALSVYCMDRYGSDYFLNCMTTLKKYPHLKNGITAFVSILVGLVTCSYYAAWCQEEADEKAIEALCIQERADIVEQEIIALEELLDEEGNITSIWFPSLDTKIEYFKKFLTQYYNQQ